jgi:hypothetical protein
MHDIKYFILNKNNQTIRRGGSKKFSKEGQIIENITEKYYFSKSERDSCLPEIYWIRPCFDASISRPESIKRLRFAVMYF